MAASVNAQHRFLLEASTSQVQVLHAPNHMCTKSTALKDFLNSWLTRDENYLVKIRKDKA